MGAKRGERDPQHERLVEAFLEKWSGASGNDVAARVPGVTQSTFSRWQRGAWKSLTPAKRAAIEADLEKSGPGEFERGVARAIGEIESTLERLRLLARGAAEIPAGSSGLSEDAARLVQRMQEALDGSLSTGYLHRAFAFAEAERARQAQDDPDLLWLATAKAVVEAWVERGQFALPPHARAAWETYLEVAQTGFDLPEPSADRMKAAAAWVFDPDEANQKALGSDTDGEIDE